MYGRYTHYNLHSSPLGWGSTDLRTVPRAFLSQEIWDTLSHVKSSWEGLVSWSLCHRKGPWSTLEAMWLTQGTTAEAGGCAVHWWDTGLVVRRASFSPCHEHHVALKHLFQPSLPSLFLPLLPLLFQVFWARTDPALCACEYTPGARVSLEPFGYCHNTNATAWDVRRTAQHFDQGCASVKTSPVFYSYS